ncbi:putative Gram-negative bacteria binding protein [Seiridium cardinale]|uniref:Gram-negative bacteria binding protein n=1 Tax=Seiridium cardinale TaxID=138064 RepID=A0ABR2XWC8_9PEZI
MDNNPFRRSRHADLLPNPFDTPDRLSIHSVATSRFSQIGVSRPRKERKFKPTVLEGTYERPWLKKGTSQRIWDPIILIVFVLIGLATAAYIVYLGWISVENPDYCIVFSDDFSQGIRKEDWNWMQEVGGFGTGSFDWTTDDSRNAYADETGLHIVPTLTTETFNITNDQLLDKYTLNLTETGTCSTRTDSDCAVVSNITTGAIINPIRSARLTTQGKHTIRYGKVEVVAKLPKGDWIWPAIWMMPDNSSYGVWPRSGEIDIMESRGNNRSYSGGRAEVMGTLHWGPSTQLDAYHRTTESKKLRHGDFSDDFHIFGVEWSDSYIYMYIDNRLTQSLYVPFGASYSSLFHRGQFENTGDNPWNSSNSETLNAPFDQEFYLILNVAVGSSGGFFSDEAFNYKPWVDYSATAARSFWGAKDTWLPTWGEGDQRGMTVKSVTMWKRGACGSSGDN